MAGGCAGVVLAGGRSSRMGTPKAALEWHGSTLLRRTVGVVARATEGPVVVVRASGQELPELPPGTLVVDDPRPGKGPVQGIAAGLAALAALAGQGGPTGLAAGGERPEFAFVSSTDLPFLHPAFVALVLRLLREDGSDVALPVARGYRQPLAAGYRVALAETAERLVAADLLRPAFLYEQSTVTRLDEARLRRDRVLAAVDPELDSVLNVNEPADYRAARARPAPAVTVQVLGTVPGAPAFNRAAAERPTSERPASERPTSERPAFDRPAFDRPAPAGPVTVRAATVRGAAAAAGVTLGRPVTVELNGRPSDGDGEVPLATGDAVVFWPAGSSQGSPS